MEGGKSRQAEVRARVGGVSNPTSVCVGVWSQPGIGRGSPQLSPLAWTTSVML